MLFQSQQASPLIAWRQAKLVPCRIEERPVVASMFRIGDGLVPEAARPAPYGPQTAQPVEMLRAALGLLLCRTLHRETVDSVKLWQRLVGQSERTGNSEADHSSHLSTRLHVRRTR